MKDIGESSSESDYKYYPIEYTNAIFANVISQTVLTYAHYGCWVNKVDKAKFLIGIHSDWANPGDSRLNVISVGF